MEKSSLKSLNKEAISTVLLWIALLVIILTYLRHAIHEPDIWWHLAHGRFMMENRTFLRGDIFSHTLLNKPWINFEWLSQILFYLLVRGFDLQGLYWAKVLLGLSSISLLAGSVWKAGARGPLLFLLTWLGYHLLQVRLCTRIELITLNFLPLFVGLSLWGQSSSSDPYKSLLPWIFGLLMVFWCNTHGGFIYGLALLILFSAGARWAKLNPKFISMLDRSALICVGATLINPFGPALYKVFYHHLKDFRSHSAFVGEWLPPTLSGTPYFWATALAVLVSVPLVIRSKNRAPLFWIPAAVLFAFYGTRYIRTTALLAFVAMPLFAALLKNVKRPLILSLLCVLCLAIDVDFLIKPAQANIVDWKIYPKGSCQFVKEHNITGRMYNPLGFGGYIDWALGPQEKCFTDGRYIFYPILVEEERLLDSPEKVFKESTWETFFTTYAVDYAITRYGTEPFLPSDPAFFKYKSLLSVMFPTEKWALVYWDDASLVFLRRVNKFSDLIRTHEYASVQPQNPGRTVTLSKNDAAYRKNVLTELARHNKDVGETERETLIRQLLNE